MTVTYHIAMTILAAVVTLALNTAPLSAATPLQLSERQLDKVTAGSASAGFGTGQATGSQASTTVFIITTSGPGPIEAATIGQVTAAGTAPDAAMANATSSLSLSLTLTPRP
jgi:hypothetical protein